MKRLWILLFFLSLGLFAKATFCQVYSGGVYFQPVTTPSVYIPTLNFQQIPITQISIPAIYPSFNISIPAVVIPSIYMPTIGFSSISIPSVTVPNFAQTIIGSGISSNQLYGLRFDDVRIANPDFDKNAKSVASITRKDFTRLGFAPESTESQLQVSLLPAPKQLAFKN